MLCFCHLSLLPCHCGCRRNFFMFVLFIRHDISLFFLKSFLKELSNASKEVDESANDGKFEKSFHIICPSKMLKALLLTMLPVNFQSSLLGKFFAFLSIVQQFNSHRGKNSYHFLFLYCIMLSLL